jgi:hypothetical protein
MNTSVGRMDLCGLHEHCRERLNALVALDRHPVDVDRD